jgi:peptidoglycan/LPS O-acetylase OafA/YrhL
LSAHAETQDDRPGRAPAEGARLHALDGLRGAAAVAVVAFHVVSFAALPPAFTRVFDASPFGAFANGPAAVHVFFVLSGFVLALSLARDGGAGGVARYYARRVLRIHPPYVAAVLFAWSASQLVVPAVPPARAAQLGIPWVHVAADRLPLALAFPSMAFGLLPVGWSLFVEMAMSLLFPLLLLVARRVHPLVLVAIGAALLVPIDRRVSFLVFTLDFALGIALCLGHARIARWIGRLPAWAAAVWMLAGLQVLQLPQLLGWDATRWNQLAQGAPPKTLVALAIGAALLVAGAAHLPAVQRLLTAPVARFYGRISYSLYLVHLTVLLVPLALLRGGDTPIPAALVLPAFAAVLAVSTALAALGHRFVEAPSIRLGKKFGDGPPRAVAQKLGDGPRRADPADATDATDAGGARR